MHSKQTMALGFTLVEMLVVISLVALLMAILLPQLSKARASARRIRCLSNMRQLHLGAMTYSNDFAGWGFQAGIGDGEGPSADIGQYSVYDDSSQLTAFPNYYAGLAPNKVANGFLCPSASVFNSSKYVVYKTDTFTTSYVCQFGTSVMAPSHSWYWYGWSTNYLNRTYLGATCTTPTPNTNYSGMRKSNNANTYSVPQPSLGPAYVDICDHLGNPSRHDDDTNHMDSGGTPNVVFMDGHTETNTQLRRFVYSYWYNELFY